MGMQYDKIGYIIEWYVCVTDSWQALLKEGLGRQYDAIFDSRDPVALMS